MKFVNLQYNKLVTWDPGTKDSLTKRLMLQALFFFTISCKTLSKNCFNLFFHFLIVKIKNFECSKSIRNNEKNNTWNIRSLVNGSFVQASQRTSVLYCRLMDFWWCICFFPGGSGTEIKCTVHFSLPKTAHKLI